MKTSKILVLIIFLAVSLAITVASQISQSDNRFDTTNVSVINDKITLEEKQDCKMTYYNEAIYTYGNATKIRNTTGLCFNPLNLSNYPCINGTETYESYEVISSQLIPRNRSDCISKSMYLISINENGNARKMEIDSSNWGPCVSDIQDGCLIITCVSFYDGAHLGRFTNCVGGKTCQRFRICDNEVKIFYKNSREDFVEHDPTFYLEELAIKGVGQ